MAPGMQHPTRLRPAIRFVLSRPVKALENHTLISRRSGLLFREGDAVGQIREYLPTFVTEFAVLISQLLTYKLAAHLLGPGGFSEYAVARRTIMLIYPVAMLGLGVGLPRFIGRANASNDPSLSSRYLTIAFVCVGSTTFVGLLLINIFKHGFAYLFFGGGGHENLVLPLSLMLLGLNLHGIIYSYFRGRLAMKQANTIQFINLGMVPLIAFFFFGGSVFHVLEAIGVLSSLVSGCTLVFTMRLGISAIRWPEAQDLLRYSLQRVPADFTQFALFALPATFVTHLRGLQEGGFIAFGISILSMIGALFAPVGIILLPRASRMLADGRQASLRQHVLRIVKVTVIVSIGITAVIEVFSKPLIGLYLGPGFEGLSSIIRTLSLAALPYALYCVLRSLVDAYHKRAVNTVNNAVGLAVFLACSSVALFSRSALVIPISLVAGLAVLGILTIRIAGSILRESATVGIMKPPKLEFERS
jgi:O-antigen/teichoic acid export membrane protein